jgi:threonine dehydratase
MSELVTPTLEDIKNAKDVVHKYLPKTPLHSYEALNQLTGLDLFIKHENHLPVGAFKVRGGVYLISQLSDEEKERGVVTASTGNHAQSIAYGAKLFDVSAKIVMPNGANPAKVDSVNSLGAEVIFFGADFDEAREHAAELGQKHGYRYVHSANEPQLIMGVGTYALEMLEDQPGLDVIIVPVGAGSGACGCCVVAKSINPHIEVIAVQAEKAPAQYLSWSEGMHVEAEMTTFAEGLATRVPFDYPQQIMREHLDDFVLVSEEAMCESMIHYLELTRNLVEAAGAATLAAAINLRGKLARKKVGIVLSGGNISVPQLKELLATN